MENGLRQLYLKQCFETCFCLKESNSKKIQCQAMLSLIKSLSLRGSLDEECSPESERVAVMHPVSRDGGDRYLDWRLPDEEWSGVLRSMMTFMRCCKRSEFEIREMWALVREQFAYDDDSSNVRSGEHTSAWLCRVRTQDRMVVVRSIRGFDIRGSADTLQSLGVAVGECVVRGSLPFIYGEPVRHRPWETVLYAVCATGEVFVPSSKRDREMLEHPWLPDDAPLCWRPTVESSGHFLAVPVADIRNIVALEHKHVPLHSEFGEISMTDVIKHLKRGLPGNARCCGPTNLAGRRVFACDTRFPNNKFHVVGRCCGRPWRLETTRSDSKLKTEVAAEWM